MSLLSTYGSDTDVQHEVEGETPHRARAIVISGSAGVGKGYIIEQLLCQLDSRVATVCGHTSREPRSGEREGLRYYFAPCTSTSTSALLPCQADPGAPGSSGAR